MIGPYKIQWQNLSSLDFNLWVELSFDEDSGSTSTFLNRENITTEHYNGKRTIHRARYTEVLTPTITFIKQNYEDFTADENRSILSWLTSSEKPGYLEVFHDDSEVVSYRLLGNWTTIDQYKLGNGRVVGYVATFESSTPYALSRKITYPEVYGDIEEIANNDEDNDYLTIDKIGEFNITCNSDEYGKLLYPKVTIKFTGNDIYMYSATHPLNLPVMIPRVIYSYTYEKYKESELKDVFDRLSDETKEELGIPIDISFSNLSKEDKDKIGNWAELNKVNITEYYINTNTVEDGKSQIIGTLSSDVEPDGYTADGLYYFSDDQNVKKVILTTKDDGTDGYAWQFVCKVGAAVKIHNTTTSEEEKATIITGAALGEEIILDGENKVITSNKESTVKIIGDDFNFVWPALTEGTNSFVATGNCDIKFEWVEPRKVGSL